MKSLFNLLRNKEPCSSPPIWMMRQAGRYLPEYRAIRTKAGSFLDLVYNPHYATEVTLQPIERYGMDGAILFSDILIVPHALGQRLTFKEGEGPLLESNDLKNLSHKNLDDKFSKIYETVSHVKHNLDERYPNTSLIGFAGAPWTVACYMVQGHGKTDFPKAFEMMEQDPKAFHEIIEYIINATVIYLKGQVRSGCEILQLFDSWAGLFKTKKQFEQFCIEPTKRIIQEVRALYPDVPFIGFPRHVPIEWLNAYIKETAIDGLSVGEDICLSDIKTEIVLQGNLDNRILLSGGEALREATQKLCDEMSGRPFIFNLGHGIIKETPPSHVQDVLDVIRTLS